MKFLDRANTYPKTALSALAAMLLILTACKGLVPPGGSEGAAPPETVVEPEPATPAVVEVPEDLAPVEPATAPAEDPTEPETPDLGEVPAASKTPEVPEVEAPVPPPVEMGDPNDLAPKVEIPAPNSASKQPEIPPVVPKTPSALATAPPPPSTVETPPPSAGFSGLQLELVGNNNNLQNYLPGIVTCEGLLESILERDDNAGGAVHTVGIDVRELGGSAAGVASTPPPNFYDLAVQQGLSLSLDDDLANQYGVCVVFVHEVFHTFGVDHIGTGIMSPTLSGNTMFIDGPIANAFGPIGYRFVGPAQQKLESGQSVSLAELVQDYTDTTAQELQAQRT